MIMEEKTIKGKAYVVSSSEGCTVTDKNGVVLCSQEAGSQAYFVATTEGVTVDNENASITETFKLAPRKLRCFLGA